MGERREKNRVSVWVSDVATEKVDRNAKENATASQEIGKNARNCTANSKKDKVKFKCR